MVAWRPLWPLWLSHYCRCFFLPPWQLLQGGVPRHGDSGAPPPGEKRKRITFRPSLVRLVRLLLGVCACVCMCVSEGSAYIYVATCRQRLASKKKKATPPYHMNRHTGTTPQLLPPVRNVKPPRRERPRGISHHPGFKSSSQIEPTPCVS